MEIQTIVDILVGKEIHNMGAEVFTNGNEQRKGDRRKGERRKNSREREDRRKNDRRK